MKAGSTSPVDPGRAAAFRQRLMRWYRRAGRHDLPWRQTRDPYAVLVSEVMLHQTPVQSVIPFYERWLERWPSLTALAKATPAEVITEWSGMGYYRRPLTLVDLARHLVSEGHTVIPPERSLMGYARGVGEYTSGAVLCFAFGQKTVVLDTNIGRVVARAFLGVDSHQLLATRTLREAAEALLPRRSWRDHNLALMDLGALVCTATAPKCEGCPVAGACMWLERGKPRSRRKAKAPMRFELTARYARGRILRALSLSRGLRQHEIAGQLPQFHHDNAGKYLLSLQKDGLVEQRNGRWQLPSRVREG